MFFLSGELCVSASAYFVFLNGQKIRRNDGRSRERHVVTGAFGYSGRYIAERLLQAGKHVRTLTNSPNREHRLGTALKCIRSVSTIRSG